MARKNKLYQMKSIKQLFCVWAIFALLALFPLQLLSRNAPITTAGSKSSCAGSTINIPLTINNFIQVSGISLRLDFNPSYMTYEGYDSVNANLSGIMINKVIESASLHKLYISWSRINPLTLANGTKLLVLNFSFISGTPALTFNNTSSGGGECEYADENGDAMNDIPTASYYINSTVTGNTFPVSLTILPSANPVCPGTSVTYTATPVNGGLFPSFQWKKGETNISGATNATYSYIPSNNDLITCSLTSSLACATGSPAISNIITMTVIPMSVPEITGPAIVHTGMTNIVYTTFPGQFDYAWSISSGGVITGGGSPTENSVTVNWVSTGLQWISVNYANEFGCTAVSPVQYDVTVNPAPFILITSPNGGEDWIQGSTHDVTWQANISDNVKIDLFKGDIYFDEIAASAPSPGFYSWTIPEDQIPGTDYKIRITSSSDNTVFDFSNANFTITSSIHETLVVQNVTIGSGESKCYNATQTIYIAGSGTDFVIQDGGSVTMIAGQKIIYLPGTKVHYGGYMWGYIAPTGPFCTNPALPAVLTSQDENFRSIEQSSFKIYPNPTSGKFILELKGITDKVAVDIFGSHGNKVLTNVILGENKHEFSLSDLPVGVYFIRVISGNKVETIKIIKQ